MKTRWKVADKFLLSDLSFWIFISIYGGSYDDSNGIYFVVYSRSLFEKLGIQ